MSVADPFVHTLQQLQPAYFRWKEVLDNGPKVKARLRHVNLAWRVRIEEDWYESDGEQYYTADYSNLDSRCEWAAKQLKDWKTVTRLSWQEWKFTSRKEAEKFTILYNLVWAEK